MTTIEVTVVDSKDGKKRGQETINVDHINNYRRWILDDKEGYTAVWLSNNKRVVIEMEKSAFEELITKAKENG